MSLNETPSTYRTSDGEKVTIDGTIVSFSAYSPSQKRRIPQFIDCGPLPWSDVLIDWVRARTENLTASTLASYSGYVTRFIDYTRSCSHPAPDLTPEVFRSFLRWMKSHIREDRNKRLSIGQVRTTGTKICAIYRFGAERGHGSWDDRNLDLMYACLGSECRGYVAEARQRSVQAAFAASEYEGLIRAAGLELEECHRVLAVRRRWEAREFTPKPTRPSGINGHTRQIQANYLRSMLDWFTDNELPIDIYRFCREAHCSEGGVRRHPEIWQRICGWPEKWVLAANRDVPLGRCAFLDPNPFTALAVLLGLRNGVRPEELNALNASDLDITRGYLYLHAPNKVYSEEHQSDVKVERAIAVAWELVGEWSRAAREKSRDKEPLMLFLAHATEGIASGTSRELVPMRVTTALLNRQWLPTFYRKYFGRTVTSEGGPRPVLCSDGDLAKAFRAPYQKYRNASIRNYVAHEKNLAHVQRFARHKAIRTTGTHYAHVHQADNDYAVAMALGPTARVYQLTLKNRVIVELGAELRARQAQGAATPWGICGDPALAADPPSLISDRDPAAAPPVPTTGGCRLRRSCLECEHLYLHAEKRPVLAGEVEALLGQAAELAEQGYGRDAENLRGAAALRQAHINRIDELVGSTS
jgi:integrase